MRKGLWIVLTAALLHAGELKLGKPFAQTRDVALADLLAKPDAYLGKTLQVKGKITEVCQVMGCWIMITDGKKSMIRIQVRDGEVSFPKDAPGRSVIAEGKLAKYELTQEQAVAMAKHTAEDAGRPFDPKSVKAPFVYYQIEAAGAVLTNQCCDRKIYPFPLVVQCRNRAARVSKRTNEIIRSPTSAAV